MAATRMTPEDWSAALRTGKTVCVVDDRAGGRRNQNHQSKEVSVPDTNHDQIPRSWLDSRFDKIEAEMSKIGMTISERVLSALAVQDEHTKTIYKRIERLEHRDERHADNIRKIEREAEDRVDAMRQKYEERFRSIERTSDLRAPVLQWTERALIGIFSVMVTLIVAYFSQKLGLL